MGKAYSEFIDRLRATVHEHEERILRLQTGAEVTFRKSREGVKEHLTVNPDHYRCLILHSREVFRHDLKVAKNTSEAKSIRRTAC
jgi:hypothetical protein